MTPQTNQTDDHPTDRSLHPVTVAIDEVQALFDPDHPDTAQLLARLRATHPQTNRTDHGDQADHGDRADRADRDLPDYVLARQARAAGDAGDVDRVDQIAAEQARRWHGSRDERAGGVA